MNRIFAAGIGLTAFLFFVTGGCTKIDTTSLGTDVIPEVDNINTFADTLDIETTQGFFGPLDTIAVKSSDLHLLGEISNDPLFGNTNASVFVQLKPTFYPFYLGGSGDNPVELDSVVLCLNYSGFWGDSTVPLGLQVNEVNPLVGDPYWDSLYNFIPTTYAPNIGSAVSPVHMVDIRTLSNVVKISKGNDSVQYQVRLKLDNSSAFVQNLYNADTVLSTLNNGFYNDSTYRRHFPGLAVTATSGNAVLYSLLTDERTRLEVHFKKLNVDNVRDTIYTSLTLVPLTSTTLRPSSTANHIVRDRSLGTYPVAGVPTDEVYIQGSPGTFALLKIPELTGYPNRVIHRAAIEMTQVPGDYVSDSLFYAPNYVYVDLKDTGASEKFKSVYFDLSPRYTYDPDKISSTLYYPSTVDYTYYGGYKKFKADPISGRSIAYYQVNLTRYVQHIATHQWPNYTLRLQSPYQFRYTQHSQAYIQYVNVLGQGRVRLGGGNHPQYKMRMIIIYSNV